MAIPTQLARFITKSAALVATVALVAATSFAQSPSNDESVVAKPASLLKSIAVNHLTLDTKTYLDQAWEFKARSGLTANSGLVWNPAAREWRMGNKLPDEAVKAIAHYASWTATPAKFALNVAETYHEPQLLDELAKFYSMFLRTYFTTLGQLRRLQQPEIRQKLLGPELGADSSRTLVWYWQQPDGSVTLRDCYQCNAEYFYPAARLVRAIAGLPPQERTSAMGLFVSDYVPLLAGDHLLRLQFARRMRGDMNPNDPAYKKRIMIADEIFAVAAAAELLGAQSLDPHLVAMGEGDAAQLRDLVQAGVDRFQFSRTLHQDSAGRNCASYFNGDYDSSEDYDYSRDEEEAFPTALHKGRTLGASWDISHFNIVPMFLWSLFRNKQATRVDFPSQADTDAIANQYVFHVFQGQYGKPLFTNFFDGSDGWYRVNYSSRSNYGVAPSRFCNMFDPSHACLTIAGIYSWSLLASLNPDLARVQASLIDLAANGRSPVSCYEPQCFRERYYHYGDASFSFLDSAGQIQYSPALLVVLSELVLSFAQSPLGSPGIR